MENKNKMYRIEGGAFKKMHALYQEMDKKVKEIREIRDNLFAILYEETGTEKGKVYLHVDTQYEELGFYVATEQQSILDILRASAISVNDEKCPS